MHKSYSDPKSSVFSTQYCGSESFTFQTWQKRSFLTRLFLHLSKHVNLNCQISDGMWSW
jgi:hypothetical protein